MRMPCPGPSGETFFFASPSANSRALFLKSPGAGLVESVFTRADQRREGGVVERLRDFAADFLEVFAVANAVNLLRLLRCQIRLRQFRTAGAEESGEQAATLLREQAAGYFDLVVKLRMIQDAKDRATGARLGIQRAIDEARNARVDDGSGAHRTGLKRHVKRA